MLIAIQKWVKLIIYVNFMIKIYVQFVEIRVKNIFAQQLHHHLQMKKNVNTVVFPPK